MVRELSEEVFTSLVLHLMRYAQYAFKSEGFGGEIGLVKSTRS